MIGAMALALDHNLSYPNPSSINAIEQGDAIQLLEACTGSPSISRYSNEHTLEECLSKFDEAIVLALLQDEPEEP